MIYDCFPFFNELDLLELRLHELDPVVDKFVLVEATRTFQKESKPLYFAQNADRFSAFADKIIHVVVDEYPGFFSKFRVPTPWDYDNHQKNQVARALTRARAGDTIIISDVDEIPKREKILEFRHVAGAKVFQQRLSNYFFNCVAMHGPREPHLVVRGEYLYWRGAVMIDFEDFASFKETRKLRDRQGPGIVQIEDGGWHFSFLGDWKKVQHKLRSWAHSKEAFYNPSHLNDPKALQELIEQGTDLFGRDYLFKFIPLDDSFPRYLLENREQFSHLIRAI